MWSGLLCPARANLMYAADVVILREGAADLQRALDAAHYRIPGKYSVTVKP